MQTKTIGLIARQVFQAAIINVAVKVLMVLTLLLLLYAAYSGYHNYQVQKDIRNRHSEEVREKWENSPDKHPHRMAHYGYLVFRPKYPLSYFDFGMESFTGNTVFLEAHRQNTVNFSEAGFSTGMLRFGEISMAMILQVLFPLFIFFLGFAVVAAERENGTLKILLSQGAGWKDILLGKSIGLIMVAGIFVIPVAVVSVLLALLSDEAMRWPALGTLLLTFLFYILYLSLISVIAVVVSATSSKSKTALLQLIGLWLLFVLVLPRGMQALGSQLYPSMSKAAFEAAVEKDLIIQGDSHNPDDPHYKAIKDSLLRTYKIDSVQQLPFNYSGFIMTEGEKISANIYKEHLRRLEAIYEKQNNLAKYTAFINPYIAIRQISMALTRTDFSAYADFQEQAEAYRYKLAQHMNELQMKLISNEKLKPGDKPYSISSFYWKAFPDFSYVFTPTADVLRNEWVAVSAFLFWLLMLWIVIRLLSKKLKVI